ncbi:Fructosamine kinase-domain-containing protein [Russula dissimulans]|nr:Fructosamine kinase-domain-containing protein [Russula dissimulans]
MVRSVIPPHIIRQLERIEPGAQFSGGLPQVVSSSGKTYFVKTGSPREREQYVGEAESLRAMALAAPGLVPSLLAFGFVDENGEEIDDAAGGGGGRPYFISEYKVLSPLTERSGAVLGRRLATEMHGYTSPDLEGRGYYYGFGVPTFCEVGGCFDVLVGDLLSTLETRGGYPELCRKAKKVIPALLGPLQIKPVLLHGDLWVLSCKNACVESSTLTRSQSGNTGTDTTTGEPVIFDPSSLYGHNEADLAIARMFGGIPRSFFEEYHKHMPKTEPVESYELRGDLYELFHYLNHTVLFGGGYASSAQRKMEILLRAVE